MSWINDLLFGSSVAHSILLITLAIAIGLLLGRVKIMGISFGATFILFVGIFLGELGMHMQPEVLHFFKEFGLILFVYSIGLQVGPSFFANFKKGGSTLNLLASSIVLLGAATALLIHLISGVPISTMVGIMSGAITNTPGLGAAQQAYQDITGTVDPTIGMGYAVAYPLGVVGIIISIVVLRPLFGIKIKKEEERLQAEAGGEESHLEPLSLEVLNPALFGMPISKLSTALENCQFVVSRIFKRDTQRVDIVGPDTILQEHDRIFVIANGTDVEPITMLVGRRLDIDRKQWVPSEAKFEAHSIVVSNKEINGKSLANLNLRALHGVTVTRVTRAGIDFVASPSFTLQVGDRLTVVGSDAALSSVGSLLGNSVKNLNEPNLISIFIGIALGVLLGSLPLAIPGIPQPVKLGLAGGPLIVAILVSRFGYQYKIVTYTTRSANLMIREIGICSFLACVGLDAGNGFVETLIHKGGFLWVGFGVLITMIPLLIVGIVGRVFFRINYLTLAGMMSGSTTCPPALAYSNTLTESNATAVGYATVYPLTMFLRVLVAQLMILLLV